MQKNRPRNMHRMTFVAIAMNRCLIRDIMSLVKSPGTVATNAIFRGQNLHQMIFVVIAANPFHQTILGTTLLMKLGGMVHSVVIDAIFPGFFPRAWQGQKLQ